MTWVVALGLNFALLVEWVGPGGRVIGIDLSPEMFARAQARIERHGWGNVGLIEDAVEDAAIAVQAGRPALPACTTSCAHPQRSRTS